ncbi:MAG TPA: anthranilate synthase component I [Halanaerobiales bacterium]|nr:anthranilate synthase component I [Halanaerobiales bacterium]
MKLGKFLRLSEKYNLIPIAKEIIGDTETPVTIYNKLKHKSNYSFLLDGKGRYSFIGLLPKDIIICKKSGIYRNNKKIKWKNNDLITYLKRYLKDIKPFRSESLPPFNGGLVGYFSYDMIKEWEDLYHNQKHKQFKMSSIPLSILIFAKLIIAIDHYQHTIKVISNVMIDNNLNKAEKKRLFINNRRLITEIIKEIKNNKFSLNKLNHPESNNFVSNTSKKEFYEMVKKARELILTGEIFQVVLSQKFSMKCNIDTFQIYRALRIINPSPYLFYLNFPETTLIGSSPEVLVKVNNKKVVTRPLAGTRPRGKNNKEDIFFKRELLNDDKEKAEHIMLVDLGRNDLGRVCKTGSISVSELMKIEKYSSVMHIVSQVEGELKPEYNSLDVLKATFPAGTVSGAPKVRAMEIINELEKEARGVYAGAVGYIDFSGNLDACITIRTFSFQKGILNIQVGAGIVLDSQPEKEYQETLNKAMALFRALKIIRKDGDYDLDHRQL